MLFYNVTLAWLETGITLSSILQLALNVLIYTILAPIMPRFIISVRELYDRDLRGRWQGVDTGFGVFAQTVSSGNVAMSAIQFADVAPGQKEGRVAEGEVDESETNRLEMRDPTCQV